MNFQTSKRIMCFLMAALILCCAVVRPLEASASALATGAVVGFALEPAISSILVALGVVGTTAVFTELVENISKNVPSEYIIKALDGTEYLSAVSYNDITYVSQELVKWVQNCVFGAEPEVTNPAYKVQFNSPSIPGDVVTFDYLWERVYSPELAKYPENGANIIHNAQYVYSYDLTDCRWFNGFYYFGNSEPILEWQENVYVPWLAETFERILTLTVPDDAVFVAYNHFYQEVWFTSGLVYFPEATDWGNSSAVAPRLVTRTAGFTKSESLISRIDTNDLPWVYPGIHIIILPEDPPQEPEETEPPETEPPETNPLPSVPDDPDPETPSEPEPDVTVPEETDPAELPEVDPSTPSEPDTPEEDNPVENPNKYETYIPVKFPNEILDPNEVTQPEIQTGNGSERPEIETGNTVEIEDPNRTDTEEPTQPDDDTEWGDPVVWPDFPHVDTPEVPFPGTDNDYTGNENDTSWLTKIGEWIKWLGELIKEWIKWLGEYIVEWIKWLGEIVQLLPDAIAALLKLMVQWLVDAFKPLFQKLAEWLQPLMDYLLEGLKKLFVPKDGYFDEKIELLKSKFPLLNSVLSLADLLKAFFLGLGATPPIIYIDLGAGSGWHYMGGRTIFVDFSWYAQYKPTMDAILSAFLWLWFAWRLLLRMPGIIQGASAIEGTRESVYMIQEREKR